MIVSVTPEGGLLLAEIDRVLMAILREAPESADPHGDARALDRLYSPPANAEEQQFVDDWQEYVQPDLQHLFESAIETVRRDLAAAETDDDGCSLAISGRHIEAWISCLNQARLVLAERHHFSQDELEDGLAEVPVEPRHFALFKMAVYASVLEVLIRLAGGPRE